MNMVCWLRGHNWDLRHRSTQFIAPNGYIRCARCGEWQTHYVNVQERLIGGPFDGMQHYDDGRPNLVIAYHDNAGSLVEAYYSHRKYRGATPPPEVHTSAAGRTARDSRNVKQRTLGSELHTAGPAASLSGGAEQLKLGSELRQGDIIEGGWIIDSIEYEVDRWYLQLHRKKNDEEEFHHTSQLDSLPFFYVGHADQKAIRRIAF
jgi:hypothetical protein